MPPPASVPIIGKVEVRLDEAQFMAALAQSRENAFVVAEGLKAIAKALEAFMVPTGQITRGEVAVTQAVTKGG